MSDGTPSTRRIGAATLIAALLVAATGFFVWGVLDERSTHNETSGATSSHQESGGGEAPGEHAAEGGSSGSASEYQPLGIDLESDPFVIAAAAVSLALAGLVVFRASRTVFAGVAILGVAFAIFEIVEFAHQLDVDESGLAALAAIAGILHIGAAALAARQFAAPRVAPSVT